MKKIGTWKVRQYAWSTSRLSHRPSEPAYYIVDCRILNSWDCTNLKNLGLHKTLCSEEFLWKLHNFLMGVISTKRQQENNNYMFEVACNFAQPNKMTICSSSS